MKKQFLLILLVLAIKLINAQWQKINRPFGGNITAFAHIGNNIFAGTENSGVFLSTDNGASWKEANEGLYSLQIGSLAVAGNQLFAGTSQGVYSLANNGKSWEYSNFGFMNVNKLFTTGTTIFAGGDMLGLNISTDNGLSWKHGKLYKSAITSLLVNGATLYAGTKETDPNGIIENKLFRSETVGENWTDISTGLPNTEIISLHAEGAAIFAGTASEGIFVSIDNGSTWKNVYSNRYIYAFASTAAAIYAATDAGILLSSNNGSSWKQINNGLTVNMVKSLFVNGTTIFAGTTGGGIFTSADNGNTWKASNNGISDYAITPLIANGSTIFAGTNGGGVFASGDNGSSWSKLNNGLPELPVITSLAVNGNTIIAGIEGAGIYSSTDKGANWKAANNGITNFSYSPGIAINGNTAFALCYDGIFKSVNNTASWKAVNSGIEPFKDTFTWIGLSGTTAYALSNSGEIFVSANNGDSWKKLDKDFDAGIISFAVDGAALFAGTYQNGIYISTNKGLSWQQINEGLTNLAITSIAVSGKSIFVGTGGGVFVSNNKGASWIALGITHLPIRWLEASSTTIFAATLAYNEVWKRPLSDVAGIKEGNTNSGFEVYPNPASNRITVASSSNISKAVTINIFDVTGNNILMYQCENQQQFDIDMSKFSKGIYLLQLQTENKLEYKKLVIE